MIMRLSVISVIVFLLVSASAACPGPMFGGLLRHPGFAGEAGLTEEQRAELEDLFVATEKQIISSEAEMKTKQLEIEKLIRSEQPDMRKIRRLVRETEDARSSARLARIERNVRMRQILRPGQLERSREAVRARMSKSKDRGQRARGRSMRMDREHREGCMRPHAEGYMPHAERHKCGERMPRRGPRPGPHGERPSL
jgi:Spy/CpxP family protein refolding chaperone